MSTFRVESFDKHSTTCAHLGSQKKSCYLCEICVSGTVLMTQRTPQKSPTYAYVRGRSQTTLTSFGLFLTTYPPNVNGWHFLPYNVDKNRHFLTTYPSPLVNVVSERPLSKKLRNWKKIIGAQYDSSFIETSDQSKHAFFTPITPFICSVWRTKMFPVVILFLWVFCSLLLWA